MLDADRTVWTSIWEGARNPTWADMFGDVAQCGALTGKGVEVAAEAATFMEDYFTPGWLPRALGYDGGGEAGAPSLRKFCPVNPYWPEGVVSDLLTWATTLRTVAASDPPGANRMRKDTRRNISENRLMHTLGMARVAAMGLSARVEVELEVQREDTFADVVLRAGAVKAAIEIVAVTAGKDWTDGKAAGDAASARLNYLSHTHRVHFRGEVPPEAVEPEDAWWRSLERLSRRVARTGRPQTMPTAHPTGTALHVSPGLARVGTTLIFPALEVDQGRRLVGRLRQKADQTARGGPAVLWVEDQGLLGPLTPFDSLPLAAQVRELADLAAGVLGEHKHVAALVLSAGGRRIRPPRPEETVVRPQGHGLFRSVGWDRHRRTLIVPGPAASEPAISLLVDLVGNERQLLDECLHAQTGAKSLADLFIDDRTNPARGSTR